MLLLADLFPHMHPIKLPLIYVAIGTIVLLLALTAIFSQKKK